MSTGYAASDMGAADNATPWTSGNLDTDMHKGSMRIAVLLRYGLDPVNWRERFDRGEVVDASPYAYDLAAQAASLSWSVDHPESRLAGQWRRAVSRVLGFDLVHVWRNRAMLRDVDAVWTHTEREHLGVALLALLRPHDYRAISIAQSVWLWDQWAGMSTLRRAFYTRLLRRHAVEVVLSRVNRDVSLRAVPDRTVIRVPFGTHFARPAGAADPPPRGVLAVGNDRHRDWSLLSRVAAILTTVSFEVISRDDKVRTVDWPPNVTVRSLMQGEVLESGYARAAVVALPLTDNRHASGCTVAIEAISAGVPLVATNVGGIDEYVAGSGTALVEAGDEAAFAAAIESALAGTQSVDPALARRRGLGEADYIARLYELTAALHARRTPADFVDDFTAAANALDPCSDQEPLQ